MFISNFIAYKMVLDINIFNILVKLKVLSKDYKDLLLLKIIINLVVFKIKYTAKLFFYTLMLRLG